MASRTYTPTLILLGRAVYLYSTRNRDKIKKNLTPEVGAIFDALVEALAALLDALGTPTIGP